MFEIALASVCLLSAYVALTWVFPVLLRPFLWLIAHAMYRLRVYNRERIPRSGGGIIVCNHISYIDWLMLWLACSQRLNFVLWDSYYRNPILRFFLSWGRKNTIRIDDRTTRPHAMMESLKKIAAALDSGQLVLVFPEGGLTRSGNMLPFGRGIECVLKMTTTDVPVIPAAIHGLWDGYFSYGHGHMMRKLPKKFRAPVSVWFGMPISKYGESLPRCSRGENPVARPRAIVSAANVRLAVQEALADLAIQESDRTLLVHRVFLANATRLRYFFHPCIIDNTAGPARTLGWGKTLVAALCVTSYLRSRLGESPNVGVWLPTSLGGALANIAIAFLGRTSVNLNYTAGTTPIRSALRQAEIRVVITSRRFLTRAPLELPEDIQVIYLEDVLEAVTRWQRFRTFLIALLIPGKIIERFVLGLHRHKVDDPLTIVFSSGSTGEPKGVVLTHRNVGHNVASAVHTIGIEPTDRLFCVLPFFHSFGYTVCLWAPLFARCIAIYYPDPRQAKEVGELARTHGATIMVSTSTFLRFYIRRCDQNDFRTVRLLVCGAEKLPVKLQGEFLEKFGVLPLEGYGCTELSPVVSTNLPDIVSSHFIQRRNCPGTVGQPIFGVCVRAFSTDGEERHPLQVGEEGVLCSKGPNVMSGYLHQPEKTASVIKDGWYNTGDRGLLEPDGFIRITGRESRFAKIAGEMVPLERLDDELHDVLGSGERVLAVAAIPDERRGERLIVLHLPDIENRLLAVLEELSRRGFPNLWVPDRRDCYQVESMPVLGSGKLDLKRLVEIAIELAYRG
jgi:acyl-[acyl-carrier-protein]-phospholipid O-acyltransferase/long-chain-fatty-acid--[acyl-carrier-protein] ligase